MSEIPPGWQSGALQDLAAFSAGEQYPGILGDSGEIPVMGANGVIGWGTMSNYERGYLVGRVGSAGAVNRVDSPCWVSDNALMIVSKSQSGDERFLGYLLESLGLEQLATRQAQPLITQSTLKAISVKYPRDLVERRRIAEIIYAIDVQMTETRVEIKKREALRSGLAADCVSRATAEAYHWKVLGQIAEVASGVTLGSEPGGSSSVSLPYLRVANVQDGFFDLSEMKSLRVLRSDVNRYSLQPGDLLLTEGGDWDKLGRGAVWGGRVAPCLYQNHIFRVRCDRRVLIPEYLALYVSSPAGRAYFAKIAKQTSNLATINSTELKAMSIPIPSLALQRDLVDTLTVCDAAVQACSETLSSMESLREGIAEDLLSGRVRV
jgi:type I restriction enzyme S subunit